MAVPDSNLSRRERKKLETRERLLVAAWQHFNRKGFDATTVEEITSRLTSPSSRIVASSS